MAEGGFEIGGGASMRQFTTRKWLHRSLFWLAVPMVGTTAIVGAALRADKTAVWPWLVPPLDWTQKNAWWMLLAFAGAASLCKIGCWLIGEPWNWDAIRTLCNECQQAAFWQSNPPHRNRVTLFRRKRLIIWPPFWIMRIVGAVNAGTRGRRRLIASPIFWWNLFADGRKPWSGWIFPVVRSSHTSQKSVAVFLAPDDAQNAEGVAGKGWASNQVIWFGGLPEVLQNSSRALIADYARRSFTSEEIVRKRLAKGAMLARSFAAIPIEKKGTRWGVLVLDSEDPEGLRRGKRGGVEALAFAIGKLLERA